MNVKFRALIGAEAIKIYSAFHKAQFKFHISMRSKILKLMVNNSNGRIKIGSNISLIQKTIIIGDGKLCIGDNCSFGYEIGGYYYNGACELQSRYENSSITIGKNVTTNNNLRICAAGLINIEDNVLIGEGVMIMDHNAHDIRPSHRRTSIGEISSISIGENVWIGSKTIVLPGTIIGRNSIIGAGAVIKGAFPENVIIAGNPAMIVRQI